MQLEMEFCLLLGDVGLGDQDRLYFELMNSALFFEDCLTLRHETPHWLINIK